MPRITVDADYQHHVRYECPSCGKALKSPIKHIGKAVACQCGERFAVPGEEELERLLEKGPGANKEEQPSFASVAASKGLRVSLAGLVFLGTVLGQGAGVFRDLSGWIAYPVAALSSPGVGALIGSLSYGVMIVSLYYYSWTLLRGPKKV